MKSIITILALMLTFSGFAQNSLPDYKVQKIIKENSTAFIGKTDQGLIAYKTSSEGKLALGYFNTSNDFTEINHASLGDYRVEKAFLRNGKVVLITSNRDALTKMDKKKRGPNASLYFNTLTINLETKEVKKKIKAVKYLFVLGNRLTIEESPNQKFTVIWYGFQIIKKTIISHFTVLGADFSKVYGKTYNEERVKYEYKNLSSILVSNIGDLAIMTKGNYSPKTHKIIPLRLDYYLDPEVDGDDYPGLYTLTGKKYGYMTNHIAIHCFGKEQKKVKFDIDFERQYEFVVRKGCKMTLDQDGLIHVAGLFSDAYASIHAKGIFRLELNPKTGDRKDIYHEYFTENFVLKVLPTDKLKEKARAVYAKEGYPEIAELEVRDFQLKEDGTSLLVLEYIDYEISNAVVSMSKAFTGNLVFLELSKTNEISWFSSIEKKQLFAFPKNLYGVNKIYTAFDQESGYTVLFNEWKPTDKLKKKSKFGVDVDFPKLVGYTVSLDGTVSEKTMLYDSSADGVLVLPNKSIRMDANQFILKGDKEREITYFNLSK